MPDLGQVISLLLSLCFPTCNTGILGGGRISGYVMTSLELQIEHLMLLLVLGQSTAHIHQYGCYLLQEIWLELESQPSALASLGILLWDLEPATFPSGVRFPHLQNGKIVTTLPDSGRLKGHLRTRCFYMSNRTII